MGVFVGEVLLVGVDAELCSVVAGVVGVEEGEGCELEEDVGVLLVDVCCCGDDVEDSVEAAGVGEVFCGEEIETTWRGA